MASIKTTGKSSKAGSKTKQKLASPLKASTVVQPEEIVSKNNYLANSKAKSTFDTNETSLRVSNYEINDKIKVSKPY